MRKKWCALIEAKVMTIQTSTLHYFSNCSCSLIRYANQILRSWLRKQWRLQALAKWFNNPTILLVISIYMFRFINYKWRGEVILLGTATQWIKQQQQKGIWWYSQLFLIQEYLFPKRYKVQSECESKQNTAITLHTFLCSKCTCAQIPLGHSNSNFWTIYMASILLPVTLKKITASESEIFLLIFHFLFHFLLIKNNRPDFQEGRGRTQITMPCCALRNRRF